MKTFTTAPLALALSGTVTAVQADTRSERDLAQCMTQLQAIYGEETELNLVDRRRNQHGTRMRVAARLDSDNTYFAHCWVAKYDEGEFDYAADSAALAANDPVVGAR